MCVCVCVCVCGAVTMVTCTYVLFVLQYVGHEIHVKVNSFTMDLFGRTRYVLKNENYSDISTLTDIPDLTVSLCQIYHNSLLVSEYVCS